MEIMLDHKFLKLEYYPEGNYLVELWNGFTTDQQFAELLDKIITACEARNIRGIVIDARDHKGLSPGAQKLAADVMERYAKKAGHLYQAIMVPKDIFSKLSVNNYSKQMDKNQGLVDTRFFDDLKEAQNWLKECAITA